MDVGADRRFIRVRNSAASAVRTERQLEKVTQLLRLARRESEILAATTPNQYSDNHAKRGDGDHQ